jgi:hypothetical protein
MEQDIADADEEPRSVEVAEVVVEVCAQAPSEGVDTLKEDPEGPLELGVAPPLASQPPPRLPVGGGADSRGPGER